MKTRLKILRGKFFGLVFLLSFGIFYGAPMAGWSQGETPGGLSASSGLLLEKLFEFSGYESTTQNTGLIEGADQKLYGWIAHAGTERRSVLWRSSLDGSELTIIHTFTGLAEDGEEPNGLVYGSDGMLYGTARDQASNGRIFSLSADGGNYEVLKVLSLAEDMTREPFGLMEASDGRLYGITGPGGGNATLYGISKDGSGFEVLHRFGLESADDGRLPRGLLLEGHDGQLYGVTASDFTTFAGTVFRIGRDGSGYEILHRFGEGQGVQPDSGLVLATDGFLYGQVARGGENGLGGVFKLRADGSDYQLFPTGYGGAQHYRAVIESGDGYLYALHPGGGAQFNGLIFRVRRDGTGLETLHEFLQEADPPVGVRPKQLLHASDGSVYCMTYQRSPVPIASLTAYTPYLMRFGPVPLPGMQSLKIDARLVRNDQDVNFTITFTGEPESDYVIHFAETWPPGWEGSQTITTDEEGNAEFVDDTIALRTARYFRVASQ